MFSRKTSIVWVGLLFLSGMFLMGQDTWDLSSPTPKTVFLSWQEVTGNIGGVAEADQICQDEADDNGLSGTYMAWISDSTSSPDTRFTKNGEPYQLPGGQIVADDWEDLTDGELGYTITQYADGLSSPWGPEVWANTLYNGIAANTEGDPLLDSCNNWTIGTSPAGAYTGLGSTIGNVLWSNRIDHRCDVWGNLYCFQQ